MNLFSCFATRVPSAPRAEPENVSTVSCFDGARVQAAERARSPRLRERALSVTAIIWVAEGGQRESR
jgi:hypothetical protein